MTPAQLKAMLDAATKRPWRDASESHRSADLPVPVAGRGGATIAMVGNRWVSSGVAGGGRPLFAGSPQRIKDAAAIVASMNAADALVELWEVAAELADFTYSDSQAEAIERLGDALRRLEELP